MQVVGVDGFSGGWIAAAYDSVQQDFILRTYDKFRELINEYPEAACIAVDIPIGLAKGEPRRPDVEARKVLGPRHSSVFPAPDSRLLSTVINEGLDYDSSSKLSRNLINKSISKQTFAILPKIAEVNAGMSPQMQQRIVEVHPEVSFWALAGRPLENPKRKKEGFEERRVLLSQAFEPTYIPGRGEAGRLLRSVKADDILDAMVAAWTAQRFATGKAGRLPSIPDTDHQGLRMEIVY